MVEEGEFLYRWSKFTTKGVKCKTFNKCTSILKFYNINLNMIMFTTAL